MAEDAEKSIGDSLNDAFGEEETVEDVGTEVEVEAEVEAEAESSDDELEFELPEHWGDNDKEEFKKIADRMQALAFAERKYKELDGGFQKKMRELSDKAKVHDVMEEVFGPYKQEFAANGLDTIGGVRQIAAVHGMLKQDPVGSLTKLVGAYKADPAALIQQIARQYGVDLLDLETGVTPSSPQTSPANNQVLQQIEALKQQQEAYLRQQQEMQEREVKAQIDAFVSATDSEGNSLHPRFDELAPTMKQLLDGGVANGLEDAYTKAAAIVGEPTSSSFVRSKAEAVKKAKRAAQSSVKSSAPPGAKASKPGGESLRADIERNFDAIMGRSA